MNSIRELILSDFSNAADVCNFRIASDGTLSKRGGCVLLSDFGTHVRGMAYDGSGSVYAVAGIDLWRITNGYTEWLCTLYSSSFGSQDERCLMTVYNGYVYIFGGGAFYRFDIANSYIEDNPAYAPICRSSVEGYTKESFNLTTSRVREVFTMNTTDTMHFLGSPPEYVYAVTVDGVLAPSSEYTISKYNDTMYYIVLDVSLLSYDYQTIIVEYSLKPSTYTPSIGKLIGCRNSFIYEGASGPQLFVYNNNEGCIYYSAAPSEERGIGFAEYFPEDAKIFVGDGSEHIRAITRHGDRIVVLTQIACYYLVEKADGSFSFIPINKEIGIGENSETAFWEDCIYFVNPLGVYRIFYDALEDKYAITLFDVPARVKADCASARLTIDRLNRELWLVNGDNIAVMNLVNGKWYRFTGFTPSLLLTYQNMPMFADRSKICVFSSEASDDCGVGIDAYVETHNIDFGSIFVKKTIYGFGAALERRDGAVISCKLTSDKGHVFDFSVASDEDSGTSTPVVKRTHARLGGCYYIICRITSPGNAAPANVRQVMLRYRVAGGA